MLIKESENTKDDLALSSYSGEKAFKSFLFWALLFLLLFLLGDFMLDYKKISGIKNTELTLSNAEEKIQWLEDYSVSYPFRHLISKILYLSSSESVAMRGKILLKYDDLFWRELLYCNEAEVKYEKLKKYEKLFPNGQHLDKIPAIITELESKAEKETCEALLLEIERQLFSLKAEMTTFSEELKQLIAGGIMELKKIVKPEYALDERLKAAEIDFFKQIEIYNQQRMAEPKADISTKLSSSDPANWLMALRQTLNLKENMDFASWKDFAEYSVMERFYKNYDNYVEYVLNDEFPLFDELILDLEKADTFYERRQILRTIGYLRGEEDWFKDKIAEVEFYRITKKYRRLVEYSKSAEQNFLGFLSEAKDKISEIDIILLHMKKYRNLYPVIKDLENFQRTLQSLYESSQTIEVAVTSIEWGKLQSAFSKRKIHVKIAEVSYIRAIPEDMVDLRTWGTTLNWGVGSFEIDPKTPRGLSLYIALEEGKAFMQGLGNFSSESLLKTGEQRFSVPMLDKNKKPVGRVWIKTRWLNPVPVLTPFLIKSE